MPVVRANRKVKAGKHAILDVFPGLDKSVAFRAIFPDGLREEVLRDCRIDVVPEDMYMYIDDEAGNVVAGLGYLKTGEEKIVYLDVLHELTHIRQWHARKELWDRRYNYVDRPTEIEAYQVAVDEARNPSYKLQVDFGPFGIKRSSAPVQPWYSKPELLGRRVIAVTNFPPRQIGPFMSEVLCLGAVQSDGRVVLLRPDVEGELGARIA